MNRVVLVLVMNLVALESRGDEKSPTLLIVNKLDNVLMFVATDTLRVLGTALTGHHPHEVAVTPDGRTAFVANYGAGDSLSVIDVPTRSARAPIALGKLADPHGIAISRDGALVFVTCEANRAVAVFDARTGGLSRQFETGQELTHMLALDPAGAHLFASNLRSGSVSAIDLKTDRVAPSILTGAGCEGIDVSPDGRLVWTANKEAETLSIIDPGTNRVVATLPCRGRPIRVKFAPDGRRALVSCARSNEVAFFDVATRTESRRLATAAAPIGLVIARDGRRAYVANTEARLVSVIDLTGMIPAVLATIATGREPDGLALAYP